LSDLVNRDHPFLHWFRGISGLLLINYEPFEVLWVMEGKWGLEEAGYLNGEGIDFPGRVTRNTVYRSSSNY
jgi:hypothetical protein